MSRQNKVNPGMYTQRGRLAQDDAARELARQRAMGSEHAWQPVQRDQMPHFKGSPPNAGTADETETIEHDVEEEEPKPRARKTQTRSRAAGKPVARRAAKQAAKSPAKKAASATTRGAAKRTKGGKAKSAKAATASAKRRKS